MWGGGRKVRLCLSVSGEVVRGSGEGVEEMGMFCPVALDLLVTQKREKKKVAKRCGAVNMTQAAAKELLKGSAVESALAA